MLQFYPKSATFVNLSTLSWIFGLRLAISLWTQSVNVQWSNDVCIAMVPAFLGSQPSNQCSSRYSPLDMFLKMKNLLVSRNRGEVNSPPEELNNSNSLLINFGWPFRNCLFCNWFDWIYKYNIETSPTD